jgi:hypothetical protein
MVGGLVVVLVLGASLTARVLFGFETKFLELAAGTRSESLFTRLLALNMDDFGLPIVALVKFARHGTEQRI